MLKRSPHLAALPRYGLPVAATTVALLLARILDPLVQEGAFALFLAAVMLSAWYGGLGPGFLATLLGALAVDYFLEDPPYALTVSAVGTIVELLVFLAVATLISMLNADLLRARRRAEEEQRRATFLAEAGSQLAGSLDTRETLRAIARLVVSELAEWCLAYTAEGEGQDAALEVAARDPARERALLSLFDHGLPLPEPEGARDNPAVVARVLPGEPLRRLARDADGGSPGGLLGPARVVSVPLVARRRALGGLLFAPHPGRLDDPAELRLAEDLARRCALAVENARLYEQVHQAVRLRDDVLAVVSHDLRNPLTAIGGYVQLLERHVDRAGLPAGQRLTDGLAQIDRVARKMMLMINELVDVARLQESRPLSLRRRPTDLVALVRQAAAEQQQATAGHRISVDTAEPRLVGAWDEGRIERVVGNLLSNAVKYSPQGGEIRARLRSEDDGTTAWAVLQIEDRGIGIPAAEQSRLFERYYRASNAEGRVGGTGLGLSAARQIVQQHGGTISVESEEGRGSTFTVRLPLAASAEPAPAAV